MIRKLLGKSDDDIRLKTLCQLSNRILQDFAENKANGPELRDVAQGYVTEKPDIDRAIEDANARLILEYLRAKRKISESQAEAFLCIRPESAKLRNFQGLILLSALEHAQMFSDPERPRHAMMQFRLLYEDRTKARRRGSAEIDRFLSAGWGADKEFLTQLEAFFDELTKASSEFEDYAKQRLLPVRRIIKDCLEKKVGNKRTYRKGDSEGSSPPDGQLEADKEKKSEPSPTEDSDEYLSGFPESLPALDIHQVHMRDVTETEDSPAYMELTLEPIFAEITQEPSEQRVDNQAPGTFIATQAEGNAPASLRRSFALNAVRAESVAGSMERREKRLICLTNRLTRFEINILLSELRGRMERSDAAYVLYLALATGRRLTKLLEASQLHAIRDMQRPGNGYFLDKDEIYWLYIHELPAHALPGNQRKLLDQQKTPVVFPVPCSQQAIRRLPDTNAKELELQAEELLREINKSNATRLSVGKIADHLPNFLHHQGVDDVLIALITGNPDIQQAGLYYTQFDSISIYKAYKIFREEELGVKTQEPNPNNIAFGGSQLVFQAKVATGIFDHLAKNLKAVQSQSWDAVHNGFVMYTLHLLNFATGHRPVTDPFDDLSHIDLINKKILISDKESRLTTSSARVLALPDTAVQQIKLYTQHLERLFIQIQDLSPAFAQQVGEVLSGKRPLLFLIERGDTVDDIKMISVSPKRVQRFWAGLLDLPPNWHRHFLRTFLSREENVSAESTDTWMGHANPGQEGFTKFSGMSMKAMEKLAASVEQLMERLKIVSLTSKGHPHE